MTDIEINDVAKMGNVRDIPGYQLPPEAWTEALNMRFFSEGAEVIGGRTQVFGTLPIVPHFAMPVATAAQTFWLYVSLTQAYAYDGAGHTEVTRVASNYTAATTRDWNGTTLGGIPILNNGSDVPQYWPALGVGTKLIDLVDWPMTHRAKVVRAFGPHLFALNLTVSGVSYPHRVLWSHPADPGTVPPSWDITDASYDAGEQDLADIEAGVLVDGLPLSGRLYLYKEGSTWRVTPLSGGEFIFDFKTFLETSGILAPRCVTVTGDGKNQVVVTQDDIIIHNGATAEPILDKRYKRALFNAIDSSHYRNSFLFTNPWFNEVWFCFPETGSEHPTKALVFNYRLNTFSEVEVDFRNAANGVIATSSGDIWSSTSDSWAEYVGAWSSSIRRKIVTCATDATKFRTLDQGTTFDGSPILSTLAREGLGVVGRKRNGEWIVDFTKMKFISRLWIKASGGPINVRVGFAELPDGVVSWAPAQAFNPATQNFLDFEITGRAIAVEFTGQHPFRVEGYKLSGEVTGGF